jgi:hypothetical protein
MKKEGWENRGGGSEGATESGKEEEGGRYKDNSSLDLTMVTFVDDNRLKSIVEEEPTLEEEVDTWDWVPDSLIVEACRLDDGATTMVYGFP